MSFCNPTSIDDYFEDKPNKSYDAKALATTPEATGPDDVPMPRNQFNDITVKTQDEINAAKSDMERFMVGLRGMQEKGGTVVNGLNSLTEIYRRGAAIETRYATQQQSAAQMARDYKEGLGLLTQLDNILSQGLVNTGWINADTYKAFKNTEALVTPFLDFTGKVFDIAAAVDAVDTVWDPKLLKNPVIASAVQDIENAVNGAFNSLGLGAYVSGMASNFASFQNKVGALESKINAEVEYMTGLLDMADSLITSSGQMTIAICKMIPAILSTLRALSEWVSSLKLSLPALTWPDITLNLDLGKLFKLPNIDSVRRLAARAEQFKGTKTKLWKSIEAECEWGKVWNSDGAAKGVGPNVSEAISALGKVGNHGTTVIAAGGALEEGKRKLDDNRAGKLDAASALWDTAGTILPITPARVNTPATSASALGFRNGSTVPADPTSLNLPFGMGSINGTNSNRIDPETGLPVVPDLQGLVSNEFATAEDLIKVCRAGGICADSTKDIGISIKKLAQPKKNITEEEAKQTLKTMFEASRRQRLVKNNLVDADGNNMTNSAKDYFACVEKQQSHLLGDPTEASNKLNAALKQPPALFGSIIWMAAVNNPEAFVSDKNTSIDPATEADKKVVDQTGVTKALDEISEGLPLTAFPVNFHSEDHANYIQSSINAKNVDAEKVALEMICKDSEDREQLEILIKLEEILKKVDPVVSEGLYQKAFVQGYLTNNSYTYLSVGLRVLAGLNSSERSIMDNLNNFLLHEGRDIRPLTNWLESLEYQVTSSPPLPLGLTEQETILAADSYYFVNANKTNLANIFLKLRSNSDSVTGPLGYEAILMLTAEAIMGRIEDDLINNLDVKDTAKSLLKLTKKIKHGSSRTEILEKVSS